ncbi:MAG: hypothetical protein IJQ16_04670 [Selenomonadaceae bacterium]|nr:hypothetical protein [Selenomonadaceae bacterium]
MTETLNIVLKENDSAAEQQKKLFNFDDDELKCFVQEIFTMVEEGEPINFSKAVHNAKYFAEIDRRIAEIEKGHYVEHDIIEV